MAQKKNGRAVINEDSLKHFENGKPVIKRDASPSKGSSSSGGKGKEKAPVADGDAGDDDEESGDEAEKLNDEQLNEIDDIYRK